MMPALILAAAALVMTAMICIAALVAWRGWLELKRLELGQGRAGDSGENEDIGVRIELAAVRERLKKLEAIASGVDI